jgi:calcium-translocating P-type ATPase
LIFITKNGTWVESFGISIAVFIATAVSTISEYGSEVAFKKLQSEAENIKCNVKRNNTIYVVPIGEIVIGDLIIIQAGDRIPADGILLEGILNIDQSPLNGESTEVRKSPSAYNGANNIAWDLSVANQIFRGSTAVSGEGIIVAKRIGDKSFYGNMAAEIQEESRESPLKIRLASLAKFLSRIGYAAAVLVLVADLCNILYIQGRNINFQPMAIVQYIAHAITLGMTVIVVAVPEGLPMMITVVLSSNMFKMLKDNVMIRKLVGIETAGSMNILFTDKTGTLTTGKLRVSSFMTADNKLYDSFNSIPEQIKNFVSLSGLFNTSSSYANGKILGGNATDRVMLEYVVNAANHPEFNGYTRDDFIPFDSVHKYSSASVSAHKTVKYNLIKGAPEIILNACTRYIDNKCNMQPFSNKSMVINKFHEFAGKSFRVIAIALSDDPITAQHKLNDLTFIGLCLIRDELRKESKKAVKDIKNAGIQTVMITGDNRETAFAIAKECGIIDEIKPFSILTSTELNAMSDDKIKSILPQVRVIARALPTDKSRLVKISQELGLVVGMTGDGINDAPALKRADVGFALGSGTEIAKEASDIVILDDNISSVVKSVLYGRTIFKSIRKFIVFQLTMNLCAVGISIIAPFIGVEHPVTIIQMLWVNIIIDTLAGLAFAGEPPLEEYLTENPKRRDEEIFTKIMVWQVLTMGVFTITLSVLFLKLDLFYLFFRYSSTDIFFMTGFFTLFIFCGIFNCFNARTYRINIFANIYKNKWFIFIIFIVAAVQMTLVFYGGDLFRTAGLTLQELLLVLGCSLTVIPVDIIRKIVLRMNKHTGKV